MTTKLERYYKTIPSIYNPQSNKIVNGIVQAWAESDEVIVEQIGETKKQLFVPTAEGQFLDGLGNNVDVERPLLIALSDIFYRDLIVQMSYAPKQIRKTMYEVLDVFWGPTYSRANVTSENSEPYDFGNVSGVNGQITFVKGSDKVLGVSSLFTTEFSVGDFIRLGSDSNSAFAKIINIVSDTKIVISDTYSGSSGTGLAKKYVPKTLIVKVDNNLEFVATISPTHFANTNSVTAIELADALTSDIPGATGSTVKTISSFDEFVNLRTNTPGATGKLQVVGGTANIAIAFPTDAVTINDLVRSTIIYEINPREIVFKLPNLVAKLSRSLKGAIHIHDNIKGTILSVDTINKTITAILSQSVLKDQLSGNILAQDIQEFGVIGNTKGLTSDNGKVFDFPTATTEWVVDHNLGLQYVQLSVYSDAHKLLIPDEIKAVSENRVIIKFGAAQSGSVYISSDVDVFDFNTPTTTWTVAHNLGEKHVNVIVYDDEGLVIQPDKIKVIDENSFEVDFGIGQAGHVSVSSNFVHEQSSPSETWTMHHNLGLKDVNVTVYDDSDEVIVPNEIDATLQNTAIAEFLVNESGFAAVGDVPDDAVTLFFNPGDDISLLSSNSGAFNSPSPASSLWSLFHNLNNQYPNVSVYNSFDIGVIPQSIFADGINHINIGFGRAILGHAYLLANNSVFNFPTPDTTWNVSHGLGVQYLNVTVYDQNSNVIIPQRIKAVDSDNMLIEFGQPVAGRVSLSVDFVHDQSIASDTWTVSHGIGSKFVAVTVYNADDEVVIPEKIQLNDINTLTISSGVAFSGHAVAGDTTTSKFTLINPKYPNSFIYDVHNTFSITKVRAKITQAIAAGDVVVALSLDDASHIPDAEGYLIFNFGFANQEQPVHYLGRPNNSTILIDPTHIFAHDHSAGEIVNVLADTRAYVPRAKGQDYATYITGTVEALDVVKSILDKIKAVGVILRYVIDFPTYRFVCD